MSFRELRYLIGSDLYRIAGKSDISSFLKYMILGVGFRYCFWMRTCAYLANHGVLRYCCFPVARLILAHCCVKYGISIPYTTRIASGFYIGHFGGIVIHPESVIGRNCNISQGVTLGQANRGERKGVPTIGDDVYIGPGAKIVGNVHVGNNAAIGANCVVTKDVPDNAVMVGVPGRVISYEGSEGYVNRTDY
jgi:serine O-acetyltransferase